MKLQLKALCFSEFVVAHDGYQALEVAREEAPDLIVLDIMLPGMDGLETCRRLRQESEVSIDSQEGKGTTVRFTLPVYTD